MHYKQIQINYDARKTTNSNWGIAGTTLHQLLGHVCPIIKQNNAKQIWGIKDTNIPKKKKKKYNANNPVATYNMKSQNVTKSAQMGKHTKLTKAIREWVRITRFIKKRTTEHNICS